LLSQNQKEMPCEISVDWKLLFLILNYIELINILI